MWVTNIGGRKYSLAGLALIGSLVGLFVGVLPPIHFITALGLILGLYGYNNNKHKELEKSQHKSEEF